MKGKICGKKYRYSMLSEAGIAVFFFGNKLVDKNIVSSDGLIEEFEIAIELGLKVIPCWLYRLRFKRLMEQGHV
jgi:hypothetical protein